MPKSIEELLKNLDELFLLEINKLVLAYAQNRQLINENYLNKLVLLFIKEYKLKKYLRHSHLNNTPSDIESASYSFIHKKITIHLACFLKELNNISSLFNLSPNDITYLIYTYFNKIIFHEIAHSYELLEIEKGKNFDANLLRATFRLTTMKEYINLYLPTKIRDLSLKLTTDYNEYVRRVKIYYRYYSCAPEERLAEYFANDLTLTLTKKLENEVELKNLPHLYRYILLKNLLEGYQITLNPTLFYLKKLGKNIELPSSPTPLDIRLKYGLEITKREYTSLKRLKKSLYNKLK